MLYFIHLHSCALCTYITLHLHTHIYIIREYFTRNSQSNGETDEHRRHRCPLPPPPFPPQVCQFNSVPLRSQCFHSRVSSRRRLARWQDACLLTVTTAVTTTTLAARTYIYTFTILLRARELRACLWGWVFYFRCIARKWCVFTYTHTQSDVALSLAGSPTNSAEHFVKGSRGNDATLSHTLTRSSAAIHAPPAVAKHRRRSKNADN